MIMLKAHRLLDEDRVHRDEEHPNIWWVDATPEKRYRVQCDWDPESKHLSWITCTCPHGLHSGVDDQKCYHIAAVLIVLWNERMEAESEEEK